MQLANAASLSNRVGTGDDANSATPCGGENRKNDAGGRAGGGAVSDDKIGSVESAVEVTTCAVSRATGGGNGVFCLLVACLPAVD